VDPQIYPARTQGAVGLGKAAMAQSAHGRGTLARLTDFLSPETRSKVMSRIRSKDTKPELILRRELFRHGIRGWRCHAKHIAGKPDLAFTRWRVAIFVDGCFWHGHPEFFTPGKSGAYWDAKIARTQERDRIANEKLGETGWQVLRFWDFEVEQDLASCVGRVVAALEEAANTRAPARAA
jgi:DNA mismatch endonuclease (patch repair protein)